MKHFQNETKMKNYFSIPKKNLELTYKMHTQEENGQI